MFSLLVFASVFPSAAEIDLASLKPRDVVQLVLKDDSSVVVGVPLGAARAGDPVNTGVARKTN